MPSPDLYEFIQAAKEFCALAEEEPAADSAGVSLWRIRELLLRLMFHIPAVEAAPHSTEGDAEYPEETLAQKANRRFSELGMHFYQVVYNPHDLESKEAPVMGLLSDDLGDIYRDLQAGLGHLRQGRLESACWQWSFSYRTHWARHAVNAYTAIEIYRTDEFLDVNGPQA